MPEPARVLRIFRTRVKPGREAEWERGVNAFVTPERLASTDGLIEWFRGRRLGEGAREFVFVSVWRDKDALRAFAGASTGPVMFHGEADLVESADVEHYEIYGEGLLPSDPDKPT